MRAAAGSGSLAFNKCSAAQQGEVRTALGAGLSMVSDGDAYMSQGQPGPRYNKWFGVTDAARAATIKAHYVALKDAFANKPVTVTAAARSPTMPTSTRPGRT